MRSLGQLVGVTFAAGHELSESVMSVCGRKEVARHRFLTTQMEDKAVSALAELASAQAECTGDYFAKLEAVHCLNRARLALGELKNLVETARGFSAITEEDATLLATKLSDAMALILAAGVAVRGAARAA